MDLEKIYNILKNEEPFRLKQAQKAIFIDNVDSWLNVTTLPFSLRELLNKQAPIVFNVVELKKSAVSDSIKAILKLSDDLSIETVLLKHRLKQSEKLNEATTTQDQDKQNKNIIFNKQYRNTVCVSSQAGCALNCLFCRTAKAGFKRNLSFYEIIQQVLFFQYYLKKDNARVTNIVFMGMGEPMLNYENVLEAIKILNSKDTFNIGSRKISISTCGIPSKIEKLANENIQVNLAVSLNAPDNNLRSKLMPINKKYPIESLLYSVANYIKKTNRRVMFEYVLIKDINDSAQHAQNLSNLLKGKPLNGKLCFVNLIPYNGSFTYGNLRLESPDTQTIKKFKAILEKQGLTATQRFRYGQDISGACGQLVYASL